MGKKMRKTMTREEKLLLKSLLPERLGVKIHKAEEGGYWARIVEIDCLSQGETFSELFSMLTKAIYTYYNVPLKFIPEFGSYMPVRLIRKRASEYMPQKYTLDDILKNQTAKIREVEKV